MEYFYIFLTAIFAMATIIIGLRLQKANQNLHHLQNKYKSIISIDQYIEKIKQESITIVTEKEKILSALELQISEARNKSKEDAQKIMAEKELALNKIEAEIADLHAKYESKTKQLSAEKEKTLEVLEKQISEARNKAKEDAQKIMAEKELALNKIEAEIADLRAKYESKTKQLSAEKEKTLEVIEKQIIDLRSEYKTKRLHFENLVKELSLYEYQHEIISYGLCAPYFDFDTSEKYKDELLKIRETEKLLIKEERAAHSSITWTVNGSEAEGRKQTKHYIKLVLRAFNGECEALVADVRWNNILKMEQRLIKAYEAINKLGETHKITITTEYLQLKLSELRLTHEYREKIQREKEEQRQIQEQIREEQRIQKEIDKALKDSEDEEKRYLKALEQAKKEMVKAQGDQLDKIKEKMALLEKELEEARQQKERALSMAQQTKAGHVYVISNIGSFGENVYKIGMTRRLEPLDRVKELGDASVPFEFDVHAMLFSDDAPALENQLHKEFNRKRVNLVNDRKEFFNVHLEDIERVAKKYQHNVEFIKIAEARNYRESVAIRGKQTANQLFAPQATLEKIPVSI